MRISAIARLLLLFVFLQTLAYSQDWAIDLVDTPTVLPAGAVPANPTHLTMAEARALIQNTLQVQDSPANYVDDPNFYCIIHLVNWKSDSATVDSKSWFVFQGGKKSNAVNLEGTRIFGSRKVAVLYVHLVQAVTDPAAADFAAFKEQNNADTVKMEADYKAGRLAQFRSATGKNTLARVAGVTYVSGYPPTVALDYRIEVTRKIIAPIAHGIALLGAVAQSGDAAMLLPNRTVAIWAGRLYDIQYSTSDILVKAQMGQELKELDKKTFDDEGYYHFDISAAIPIRGIKQLQYDTTSSTATPKTVTTANAYGVVNVFLNPVDVKTNYTVWPPSILAGVGLTGHPFDKPLIGLGFGYGKISAFVGCVFNKVTQPGATAGSTNSHREEKFVFGLNLSARQVADLLKKK